VLQRQPTIAATQTYEKSFPPGPPLSGVPLVDVASAEPALIRLSSGVFQGSFFVCSEVIFIDAYLSTERARRSNPH